MSTSVYNVVELIGSSPTSWEEAAANAVQQAATGISQDIRIAEVIEQDVLIDATQIVAYRAKVRLSYKPAVAP
ncbi:MAG: dodecin domain-containing protein [Acidimicrobiales bacterium]|nr:dodecin domain-containing protein [Acidimicrobiales bacterium]